MLIYGPFDVKWGENTIEEVEAVDLSQDAKSDDHETTRGIVIEVDRSIKVSVVLTLLATDIPSLAILLPQHFVPQGGTLSTGEVVVSEDGAIDLIPHKCSEELIYNDLDLTACGNPSQTTRINNARSKLDGFDFSPKIQKVRVKLVGEAPANKAVLQIFKNPYVAPPDYLLLDDDDYFLTDADGYLVI